MLLLFSNHILTFYPKLCLINHVLSRRVSYRACATESPTQSALVVAPSVCSRIVYGELASTTAKTKKEWIEKLSVLIEDDFLRVVEGITNWLYVRENFNLKDHYKKWVEVYEKL